MIDQNLINGGQLMTRTSLTTSIGFLFINEGLTVNLLKVTKLFGIENLLTRNY